MNWPSASKGLILARRAHASARSSALAAAQKPLGPQSVMDQEPSKQPSTPMPANNTALKRSKVRKGATAAAPAAEAARQAEDSQGVRVKPEILVETAGLARALELTGTAEPKKKRARKGGEPAAVTGPATPALARARSRPVADADSPQDKKAEALAALASALRAVRAAPGKGTQPQQRGAAGVAAEGMPGIPLAERVTGRAKRAKTAPSDLEAVLKTEESTLAEAPQKKVRKRAVKGAAPAAIEGDVAPATSDSATPAKKPRAPRKKPAAAQAAAAEQSEVMVRLALAMVQCSAF